jgi:hypothetical protein
MGKLKSYFAGLGSALFGMLILNACASFGFPYKYYAMDADNYHGALRGPKPKDDLDLALCAPTESNKAPCIVMFTKDYLNLKKEYLDLGNRLIECEQSR